MLPHFSGMPTHARLSIPPPHTEAALKDGLRPTIAEGDEVALCAALVIDASGKVVAANQSARDLLGIPAKSLIGLSVPGLFTPGGVRSESDGAADEWKSLCAAALDRWTRVRAHPPGNPPVDVRVRLERAFGGAGTYMAVLLPAIQGR